MIDFAALRCHHLVTAPRIDAAKVGAGHGAARLYATLVALNAQSGGGEAPAGAVLSLTARRPDAQQLEFIVGAAPEVPGTRPSLLLPGLDAVPLPPGCTGREMGDRAIGDLLSTFPSWVRCGGRTDVLWSRSEDGWIDGRAGSFATHLTDLRLPFAWLVVAEPIPAARVRSSLQRLELEIPSLRQRENQEGERVRLESAEARYRELSGSSLTGLWDVRVLVGGLDDSAAHAAARVLCAASEIDRLPYALGPSDAASGLEESWQPHAASGSDFPFSASTELVAALVAPPDEEVAGLRLVEPHRFDVTTEDAPDDGPRLGTAVTRAYDPAGPLVVGRDTLNRHAFVTGATGSGKSQTTRTLLEELSRAEQPVPWLVIEPAKAEYSASMSSRLKDVAPAVLRIKPGDLDSPPGSLNPLEPAPGYPLQSHLDLVRALFVAAFQADEPFPQVLAHALARIYRDAGWDLVSGEPHPAHKPIYDRRDDLVAATPRYPRLSELQAAAQRVVDDIGYGTEVTSNVRGFIDVRIGSLCTGTPGRFFQGGHPLDVGRLLERNVVLELEDVTDDRDKAFLMGAVVIRLVEELRMRRHSSDGSSKLAHLTVIEEAHRLLKRSEPGGAGAASVELFADMLAEIRAYGEGIVVVEQIPSKIITDVIKNSALKVMHRLPATEDRDVVGGTMNLTEEQSRAIVSLRPGLAAVSVDGMDRPLLVSIDRPAGEKVGAGGTPAGPVTRPPTTGTRSALCHPDCWQLACTLRQMNDAVKTSASARLTLWVEAVTIAYLKGLVPGLPHADVLGQMEKLDARSRACAIAYAVERAVDARRQPLRAFLEPDDLATALAAELTHQVDTGTTRPGDDFARWQVGPHRYADIQAFLMDLAEQRKPVSAGNRALWAARGLRVSNDDPTGVLHELMEQTLRLDPTPVVGDVKTSGLLDAVQQVAHGTDEDSLLLALSLSCASRFEGIAQEITRRTS